MRLRHLRKRLIPALGILFIATACSGAGGCGGCNLEPLPEGDLPASQTLEGAAQMRVTPEGFEKLSELLPPVANEVFADGICIPRQSGSFLGATYEFCHRDDCVDESGNPGCQLDLDLGAAGAEVVDENTLRLGAEASGETSVPARYLGTGCTFDVEGDGVFIEADVHVGVDDRTGDLDVGLAGIPDIDLSGLDISGCSFVSGFADLVLSTLGEWMIDYLTPFLDDFIQGLLPDPLGVEGVLDATPILAEVAEPQSDVLLELRGIPGGHADLENDGLNLGLIAGLNTDFDPDDRSPGSATTPSPCVPPVDPPDFASRDYDLPRTGRDTFRLPEAGAFAGTRDSGDRDVLLGVSETALNLAGYHAFASGALCIGIDTGAVPQLNLGTLGILVPSLAELSSDRGNDPLLVVARPQRPVEFSVEDGSDDIDVTLHLRDFELDLYAYAFERWIRGFTLRVDLDLGLGAELVTNSEGEPAILPTFAGLDAESVGVEIENFDFVREEEESLEEMIPALLDLAVPQITSGLGSIPLPEVAGFSLTALEIEKISTAEDDFLAASAAFGDVTVVDALAAEYEALRDVDALNESAAAMRAPPAPERVSTRAELSRVDTPDADEIRAELKAGEGRLPSVEIDVEPYDESGRPLEWSWRLEGGLWRPFTDEAPLVIRDRAFAFQGRYEIEVAARVEGDYRTTDLEPKSIPVVIDSVPPQIYPERAHAAEGALTVPATDAVTPRDRIERALGPPGATEPWTSFKEGPLDLSTAEMLAGGDGSVQVFARDEAKNQSSASIDTGDLRAPVGCRAAPGAGAGGALALIVLGALALLGRRARARGAAALGAAAIAAALAAGCGGGAAACDDDAACEAACGADEAPMCTSDGCLCDDDVPLGEVGPYSALALDPGGQAWISAYNDTYGDLMVARTEDTGRVDDAAWEYVAGVPEGPVILENARFRDGILDPGPDVGRYTDIAIAEGDRAIVSYFHRDEGALAVALQDGDGWETHVVDSGEGAPGDRAGLYSALTVDDEGRAGVGYFAEIDAGETIKTQVRFARAERAAPSSAEDWTISVVDRAEVDVETYESDPFPIPSGLGLDVAAARFSDGRAVLAYYDRIEGAVKTAEERTARDGFRPPETLDDGGGHDVGRFPSVAVDSNDNLHVTYAHLSRSKLLYAGPETGDPEVVDDGLREESGGDSDRSELHFVGDDSSLVVTAGGPMVAYQDATSHELVLAERAQDGAWSPRTLAGDEAEFSGGYGFFTSSAFDGSAVTVSNWVLDQPSRDNWVELHRSAPGE